jgi:flagellar hook protein FlgE
MMRSMFSGVSGLQNHQVRMDVLGNNIANVNTTGFKQSRVTFQDMLSQTLRGGTAGGINPAQVGLGMVVGSIDTLQTQGNLNSTGKSTDMAIQGNGFFQMSDGVVIRYSRDGSFDISSSGALVNPATGYKVQGWGITAAGDVDVTSLGDITIPIGETDGGNATTDVTIAGNINSGTADAGTVTSSIVIYDSLGQSHSIELTYTKATGIPTTEAVLTGNIDSDTAVSGTVTQAVTVYDSLGVAHTIDVTFTKSSADTWTWAASMGGTAVTTGSPAEALTFSSGAYDSSAGLISISADAFGNGAAAQQITLDLSALTQTTSASSLALDSQDGQATGARDNYWTWEASMDGSEVSTGTTKTLVFDSDGAFNSMTGSIAISAAAFGNGAAAQTVALDFSDVTQFASASATSVNAQDGYPSGTLEKFSIGSDGVITGIYSNGMTKTLGQIPLAKCANPGGMTKEGDNMFAASVSSGQMETAAAGEGGRGTISNGVLEMSNVDLAQAFTDMIITQRGFQANAKIITTSDEMLSDLVNLKR